GHLGGFLEVVAGARRLLLENDLLGGPATEQDGDAIDQVLPRIVVLVVQRQLLGEAERAAARDDRHLVDRIRARQEVGDQRASGRGTTTWRSKRPGRRSAGSRTSGRLVAAMRITPSLVSNPSISTRSWFSVCSRSS